jgi:hypothetical protein
MSAPGPLGQGFLRAAPQVGHKAPWPLAVIIAAVWSFG